MRSRLCLLVLLVPMAAAHSSGSAESPPDGSDLEVAPEWIRVKLSSPPDGAFSLQAADWEGRSILAGAVAVNGSHLEAPVDPGTGPGAYFVTWSARNAVDGHASSGSWAFSIGGVAIPAGRPSWAQDDGYDVASTLAHLFMYVGLALATGSVVLQLGLAHERVAQRHSHRFVKTGLAGGALLSLGILVLMLGEGTAGMDSAYGAGLVVRLVLAALLTGLFLVDRLDQVDVDEYVQAGIVAMNLLAISWFSHAAALGQARAVGAVVDAVHQGAAFVWIGGVAGLWWLYRTPRMGGDDIQRAAVAIDLAGVTRRFSRVASICLVVVGVTGVGMTLTIHGTGALTMWQVAHGRALMLKLLLFAGLVVLGAVSHYRYVPRVAEAAVATRFRAQLRRETVVASAILVIVSVLVHLAP